MGEKTLKILSGRCHLCNGGLEEYLLVHMDSKKRVICLNCKATADSYTFGAAYLLFADLI